MDSKKCWLNTSNLNLFTANSSIIFLNRTLFSLPLPRVPAFGERTKLKREHRKSLIRVGRPLRRLHSVQLNRNACRQSHWVLYFSNALGGESYTAFLKKRENILKQKARCNIRDIQKQTETNLIF